MGRRMPLGPKLVKVDVSQHMLEKSGSTTAVALFSGELLNRHPKQSRIADRFVVMA